MALSANVNAYDYDLKRKWLHFCLFCPSSSSVRQLTCQILLSLFNFYSKSTMTVQSVQAVQSTCAIASSTESSLMNHYAQQHQL